MGYPQNIVRNKELYKKRKQHPERWTWGQLAKVYKISRPRAVAIYNEMERVNTLSTK